MFVSIGCLFVKYNFRCLLNTISLFVSIGCRFSLYTNASLKYCYLPITAFIKVCSTSKSAAPCGYLVLQAIYPVPNKKAKLKLGIVNCLISCGSKNRCYDNNQTLKIFRGLPAYFLILQYFRFVYTNASLKYCETNYCLPQSLQHPVGSILQAIYLC